MKNQTWDLVIPLRHKMAMYSGNCLRIRQFQTLTHKDADTASHILPTNYSSLSGICTTTVFFKEKEKQ